MDTLTQAALGATIAQAGFRSRLGNKAVLAGAVLGALPDIDTLSGLFGPWASMLHHRGITHSLLFAPAMAPALGWACWRLSKRRGRWTQWAHLAFWAVITHPLLDLFTTYGTQLLAPLSNRRFAIDGVPIVDPIYTLPLLLALVLGLLAGAKKRMAAVSAIAALAFTTAYLFYGYGQSTMMQRQARTALAKQGFDVIHTRAQPLLFVWLWRIVARDPQGNLQVTVASSWKPGPMTFVSMPRPRHHAVDTVLASERGRLFSWFADGMLGVRVDQGDGCVVVDMGDERYGLATDPTRAFWGVQAEVSDDGRLLDMRRVQHMRMDLAGQLRAMWNMTWQGVSPSAVAHTPGQSKAATCAWRKSDRATRASR